MKKYVSKYFVYHAYFLRTFLKTLILAFQSYVQLHQVVLFLRILQLSVVKYMYLLTLQKYDDFTQQNVPLVKRFKSWHMYYKYENICSLFPL